MSKVPIALYRESKVNYVIVKPSLRILNLTTSPSAIDTILGINVLSSLALIVI